MFFFILSCFIFVTISLRNCSLSIAFWTISSCSGHCSIFICTWESKMLAPTNPPFLRTSICTFKSMIPLAYSSTVNDNRVGSLTFSSLHSSAWFDLNTLELITAGLVSVRFVSIIIVMENNNNNNSLLVTNNIYFTLSVITIIVILLHVFLQSTVEPVNNISILIMVLIQYNYNYTGINERVCRDTYQNRKKQRNKIGMLRWFSNKIKYHFHT